jgi:hypothetical protein
MSSVPKADLISICRGAAMELFQSALTQVNNNIKDPNTSADKKRKIVLSFEFAPYIDRSGGNVTVKVETKLSSHQGVDGSFYLRKNGPTIEAFTQDDRQMGIFDGEGEAESVEDPAEVK